MMAQADDNCPLGDDCPLGVMHARLQEVRIHWGNALNAYYDPHAFRASLNAAIQALRNTTFALQNQKSVISDFEAWYGRWQFQMKNDVVMKWVNDARREIVHAKDLETESKAMVTAVPGFAPTAVIKTFDVSPSLSLKLIARVIGKELEREPLGRAGAYLRIERRWVASDLKEYELLDALAWAYGFLVGLAVDAHHHLVGTESAKNYVSLDVEAWIPAAMSASSDRRTVYVDAASGAQVTVSSVPMPIHPEILPGSVRDDLSALSRNQQRPTSLRDLATGLFEIGKAVVRTQGVHLPQGFLIRGLSILGVITTGYAEDRRAPLVWQQVVKEVCRSKADAFIEIATSSWGPASFPDDELPSRMLCLVAIAKDGHHFMLRADINSTPQGLAIGHVHEITDFEYPPMSPLLDYWQGANR